GRASSPPAVLPRGRGPGAAPRDPRHPARRRAAERGRGRRGGPGRAGRDRLRGAAARGLPCHHRRPGAHALEPLVAARARPPRRPRELRLRSYAKVNLGLEVLGPRHDGYHELRTIFQTIALHDDVVLSARPREVTLVCDHPEVPADATNLALRAARELKRFARVAAGAQIVLTKRIPVAGGLGGGSSNAATVLMGLDRLWALGLGPARLHPLARRLGADVPYFLIGGTALGLARGDEVYPLRRQVRAEVVVVDPERALSTAAVFRR